MAKLVDAWSNRNWKIGYRVDDDGKLLKWNDSELTVTHKQKEINWFVDVTIIDGVSCLIYEEDLPQAVKKEVISILSSLGYKWKRVFALDNLLLQIDNVHNRLSHLAMLADKKQASGYIVGQTFQTYTHYTNTLEYKVLKQYAEIAIDKLNAYYKHVAGQVGWEIQAERA